MSVEATIISSLELHRSKVFGETLPISKAAPGPLSPSLTTVLWLLCAASHHGGLQGEKFYIPEWLSRTSSAITQEQIAALNPCAQAILAAYTASPDVRIIVGAHPEVGGDTKGSQLLARRRAEAVVEQFVDRALPSRIFEIVPYAPPHAGDQAGEARSHTVEMFVK